MKWISNLKKNKWFPGYKAPEIINKGLVGIAITESGVGMSFIDPKQDQALIQLCHYVSTPDRDLKFSTVSKFVSENKLEGTDCAFVLAPSDYFMTMLEAPNVPPAEMAQALKWSIREMLPFPIEEAECDAFELPVLRARDNTKMAYLIAIRHALMTEIEKAIKNVGLTLKVIDIPEMSIRNIMNFHQANKQGNLVLQLYPSGGKIIWCKEGMLCVTRTIEKNLETLLSPNLKEQQTILQEIGLEIQRSLEYINSVFSENPPASIVLTPSVLNIPEIQQYLKTNIGLEIEHLNLNDLLKFKKPIQPLEAVHELLSLGAVLRPKTAEVPHETRD